MLTFVNVEAADAGASVAMAANVVVDLPGDFVDVAVTLGERLQRRDYH